MIWNSTKGVWMKDPSKYDDDSEARLVDDDIDEEPSAALNESVCTRSDMCGKPAGHRGACNKKRWHGQADVRRAS